MVDFEKILDNLDDPIAVYDKNGTILHSNGAFDILNTDINALSSLKDKGIVRLNDSDYTVQKKQCDDVMLLLLKKEPKGLDETYSDFISTVSHELRTPLTSIRGFADTMLFSFDKLENTQIQKFLAIIKDQSNRLISLIENLLSIAKMQSEKENLVYKSVDVKTQIDRVLFIMKNQHKNHIFKFNCETKIPPALADENKFQQIMINLLDNAAKYSPKNSVIEISARECKSSGFLTINVKDNGEGICDSDQSKIFEKFMRVESHLTRKAQGSGLGLYIVKNLVEKMNGKISVESALNTGSTFSLSLPVAGYTAQSDKKIMETN